MSIYSIVVFTYEDIQTSKDVEFNQTIDGGLRTTNAILEEEPSLESKTVRIDVRFWRHSSSRATIAEYDQYAQVYFMNEEAMEMFRENGIELNTIGAIPQEELPEEIIVQAKGQYLPIGSTPGRYK